MKLSKQRLFKLVDGIVLFNLLLNLLYFYKKNCGFNDTHKENCVLLTSVQEFFERDTWLFLIFFLCLHNQLITVHLLSYIKGCKV